MKANGLPSLLLATRHELYLGDEDFVARHLQGTLPEQLRELSLAHKRSLALPLIDYQARYPDRDEAMAKAYQSGAFTMAEIATHFDVHSLTVSRAVRKNERLRGENV